MMAWLVLAAGYVVSCLLTWLLFRHLGGPYRNWEAILVFVPVANLLVTVFVLFISFVCWLDDDAGDWAHKFFLHKGME